MALRVEWAMGVAACAPYASPYARHEVFFLPAPRRVEQGPLEIDVGVAGGRVCLGFP